jgi:hypothetical protein
MAGWRGARYNFFETYGGPESMSRAIRRNRIREVIAAAALAVPSIVFASPAPVADEVGTEQRLAPEIASSQDRAASFKGDLLRSVVESLSQNQGQEASPFEPPGKPPDRPPNIPGHHNPPNPPGQPPDRPPKSNRSGTNR